MVFYRLFRNISRLKYRNILRQQIPAHDVVLHRKIHLSVCSNAKMFMERENKYAFDIMTNKGYGVDLNLSPGEELLTQELFNTIMTRNWLDLQPKEVFDFFPKLGAYCTESNMCISNKVFDEYIDNLTDSVKFATDHELKSLFYAVKQWPDTPSIRTRNYIEVWAALDDECLKRLPRWSFDEILSYMALFFMLNVTKYSDFCYKSLQRLATKAKQLTPPQIVQTMFFIGTVRRPPFDMHNLEVNIENKFREFNVDELAILSMGFFKSKTPIRSMELISKIIDEVIKNSKEIHEVSLAALLKVIRYSRKINNDDQIYELLDAIQYEVPRLSVMCNVHMALVGTSSLTFHEGCLSKIANVLNEKLSQTRLKDLERLVLSYGTFNYKPKTKDCFISNVINELRKTERDEEINRYGRSFICCVGYLGLLEFYPVDLINRALHPDFLQKTYGKQSHAYGREVLMVNNMARIFCKGSEINWLSDRDVNIVAKNHTDYVPDANYPKQYNVAEKMFIDVVKILSESRGGPKYVTGNHILSHHQRGDVIMCNDKDGNPLPVNEMFVNKKFGIMYPPPDDNKWIVLVIAGRNSMIYRSDLPTGLYQTKVRELKALGYSATMVLWTIYSRCKSREEKLNYFNSLIENVTN